MVMTMAYPTYVQLSPIHIAIGGIDGQATSAGYVTLEAAETAYTHA